MGSAASNEETEITSQKFIKLQKNKSENRKTKRTSSRYPRRSLTRKPPTENSGSKSERNSSSESNNEEEEIEELSLGPSKNKSGKKCKSKGKRNKNKSKTRKISAEYQFNIVNEGGCEEIDMNLINKIINNLNKQQIEYFSEQSENNERSNKERRKSKEKKSSKKQH